MSISKKAFSGVKWTTASSLVVSITQVLQLIILSKLLNPKDFGLMAIIVLLINFSQIFLDLGLSNAIIYKKDITKKQLSTLYYLNLIIGFVLFLIVFFTSNFIADFYKEPQLEKLIKLISIVFIILPFGQQYQALLRKELIFKSISIRDIISRTVAFIFTILLAFNDYGILSLVYGNLIYNTLGSIMLIIAGRDLFKPTFEFSFKSISGLLNFGFYQMGEKIVNYLNKEIDTLIIGKLLGLEALGIYNIAKDFISKPYQIINPIITKVSFPIMAKLQDNLLKLKKIYLDTLGSLSCVNSIVFIFCFFYSKEVVLLFFGDRWLGSVDILRILSIYMLFRSIGNPVGSLQLALGKASLGFYWNLGLLFLIPIFVYFGSFYGLIGVSISLLLCQIILYYPSWKLMVNYLVPISFREYNVVQYKSWLISVFTCGFFYLLMQNFDIEILWLRIMIFGGLSCVLYLYLLLKFDLKIRRQLMAFLNI